MVNDATEASKQGQIETALSIFQDHEAGVIGVDRVDSLLDDTLFGGKGIGTVFSFIYNLAANAHNPHERLDQSQDQLSEFYYSNPDRVDRVCLRCHSGH